MLWLEAISGIRMEALGAINIRQHCAISSNIVRIAKGDLTSLLISASLSEYGAVTNLGGFSYTQSGGKGKGISGSATFIAYSAVPEPATWAMLLMGFAGLGYAAFRRNAKGRVFAAI